MGDLVCLKASGFGSTTRVLGLSLGISIFSFLTLSSSWAILLSIESIVICIDLVVSVISVTLSVDSRPASSSSSFWLEFVSALLTLKLIRSSMASSLDRSVASNSQLDAAWDHQHPVFDL